MPELSSAKTLGGVGSILALLGLVPSVGWVLQIVGLVMILVAIKYISDIVGDRRIFNNMIISVILSIVGAVVLVAFVIGSVARFIGFGNLYSASQSVSPQTIPPSDIIGLLTGLAIGLVALWILATVSAIFLRRSYKSVSARLNVRLFSTAALIYLIGAALTIILVGFVLILVAQIMLIVAFFSIPDKLPQSSMTQPQMMGPPPAPPASPPPPPTMAD